MELISIIVPVYNVEQYLECCIDSILGQTYENFELILVDDGSLDRSSLICDEYQKKDSRVRVIHKKNGGLSSARNAGLDIVKGEYITFIDSDDYIHKDFCKNLIENLKKCDADIAMCNFKKIKDGNVLSAEDSEKNRGSKLISGKAACKYMYDNDGIKYIVAWGKIYKKSFWEKCRFPLGKIHEDEYITYKLFYFAKKVLVLEEQLYFYRVNQSSITRTKFSVCRYDALYAYDEREKFYENMQEKELWEITHKKKNIIIAKNLIRAKKNKIADKIPQEYRMKFCQAIKLLKSELTQAEFEYFLYQYYPRVTKIYSIAKKIIK